MESVKRFGSSSDETIAKLLNDKDAVNTKKATKQAVQSLLAYILETGRDINVADCKPEELANLLSSFYADARKKDSSPYKLSALKGIRFGLSRHFKYELDIDIIKDPVFRKANEIFLAVSVDMKRKGLAKINHTLAIEEGELKRLYTSLALNPNTPTGLQQKVWFDLMFFLCRRGRENLREMTKNTFTVKTDSEMKEYVCQVVDELDKNHREKDYSRSVTEGRMYSNPGHPLCPVTAYKKYIGKLHPSNNNLWQRPKDSFHDDDDVWYCNISVGKNTLSRMMCRISQQAKLSQEFTNHSIRATSISVLDFNKFEARDIMKVSGHKSESSIKSYSNVMCSKRKMEMSDALTSAVTSTDVTSFESATADEWGVSAIEENVSGEIHLTEQEWNTLLSGNTLDINSDVGMQTTLGLPLDAGEICDGNKENIQINSENLQITHVQESKIQNASSTLPLRGFTPYITGCVVNFNVNVNNC